MVPRGAARLTRGIHGLPAILKYSELHDQPILSRMESREQLKEPLSTDSVEAEALSIGDVEGHTFSDPVDSEKTGTSYRARFPQIDEAKVLRKIDIRLISALCIMYLLAFLDRVNISNAVLFGLKADLKLVGNQYNTALVVFFVPYIVFEIPSNMMLKRFRPHVWLSFCMCLFGIVSICTGLTQNFSGLVATRFFLGVVETGMYPACFYMIAMWYRRAEAQKRFTALVSTTSLAGGFGGLLASGIGKMAGLRGYAGWRWVFILEGTLTCVISALLFFLLSDFPEEANWLTAEEKEFVKARLQEDVGRSGRHDPLTPRRILQVLGDYKVIVGGFMNLGLLVPSYSYAYFAPTIIQGFGHSSIRSQLLSVPPWACAFVVANFFAAMSDFFRHRFLFVVIPLALALAGFVILLVVHDNTKLQYAALYMAAMGMFTAMPVVNCWYSTNLSGHHQRAVGTAWQVSFGNIGGIIAVYMFLAKDAPRYTTGYSVCIGFICLAVVSACIYLCGIMLENRARDRAQEAGGSDDRFLSEKRRTDDLDPSYRYML
ncbi:MFS general substrate transporter [Amylocystis lapponica]|nr:MFS general substrate transporter [Amylocystis lapponica]